MPQPYRIAAIILFLTACAPESGVENGGKGEFSQERSTAFKTMMPNYAAMGRVAKGEDPYYPDSFKEMAERFTEESREPFKHFTQDPDGRTGDALPNIWSDAAAFQVAETDFHNAVDRLNTAAGSGNFEAIRTAYGEVSANCKSCHDNFRRPK